MSVLGYLRVLKRSGENGSHYPVYRNCRIGSAKKCDVRIMVGDNVAPVQCVITRDVDGQCFVQNKSDKNPTLLNGVALPNTKVELAHYDLLTAGTRTMRWEYLHNSPFYVMRAEGIHMSHLSSKDTPGRMVTVPLSALQKSPVHMATQKNIKGRNSVVTPSRNRTAPLSSRKSNAKVAVVSPTRRNRETEGIVVSQESGESSKIENIAGSRSASTPLSTFERQSRKSVLGVPSVISAKKSLSSRRSMSLSVGKSQGLKTIVSKPPGSSARKSVSVGAVSPTPRPRLLVKRSLVTPGKIGGRKSMPFIPLPVTPKLVSRKSVPVQVATEEVQKDSSGFDRRGSIRNSMANKPKTPHKPAAHEAKTSRKSLAHEAKTPRKSLAHEAKTPRKSVAHEAKTPRKSVATGPKTSRKSVANEANAPEESMSPAMMNRISQRSSSRKSNVTSLLEGCAQTPSNALNILPVTVTEEPTSSEFHSDTSGSQKNSRTSMSRRSVKASIPKINEPAGSIKTKTQIPRLVGAFGKRKLDADIISAERAAKRMKLVTSPKSPDKKKMAALLKCHGKSPHKLAMARKPLFSEVVKTNVARKGKSPHLSKKLAMAQKVLKSRPPTKKKPAAPLKLSTVIPKSFRFNSTGHADSPETIVIRKTVFRKDVDINHASSQVKSLSARRKSRSPKTNSIFSSPKPFISTTSISLMTTTPILKKKSLAPVDMSVSRTPFRKSVHFSASNQSPENIESPRACRFSLPESSFSVQSPDRGISPVDISGESSERKSLSSSASSDSETSSKISRSSGRKSLSYGGEQEESSCSGISVRPSRSVARRSLITPMQLEESLRSETPKSDARKSVTSSDSGTPETEVSKRSGARESLISPLKTLSSDSGTPKLNVSGRSAARKSLISPHGTPKARTSRKSGTQKSLVSPLDIRSSDSDTSTLDVSRRSDARKSLPTPFEAAKSSDSETPFRRSGARKSHLSQLGGEDLEVGTSRRSMARKSSARAEAAGSPSSPLTITSEMSVSRKSNSRKSSVRTFSPDEHQSLDIESPVNKRARKSGPSMSVLRTPSLVTTSSDSESLERSSGGSKRPSEEYLFVETEVLGNEASRKSGPGGLMKTPSPLIYFDSPERASPQKSAGRRSTIGRKFQVEDLMSSDSESPERASRKSGNRKSTVEDCVVASESPEEIAPRKSSGRKSTIGRKSQIENLLSSDSESPERASRKSSNRKSNVVGLVPSESPEKALSRRSSGRKITNGRKSQVETLLSLDSESPERASRKSGNRKSTVEDLVVPSESPEKALSRKSSGRKITNGRMSQVETLLSSNSESPERASRKSSYRKSTVEDLVVPSESPEKASSRKSAGRKSTIGRSSQVENLISVYSESPEKASQKLDIMKVTIQHLVVPSESLERASSRKSAGRKSTIERMSQVENLLSSDSESPERASRISGGIQSNNEDDEPSESPKILQSRKPSGRKSTIGRMSQGQSSDSLERPSRKSGSGKSTVGGLLIDMVGRDRAFVFPSESSVDSGSARESRKSGSRKSTAGVLIKINEVKSPNVSPLHTIDSEFGNDEFSTPRTNAQKSSHIMDLTGRSSRILERSTPRSFSSSVRCEASESELSLFVSPRSNRSSASRGKKRSLDESSYEEDFPGGKRLSNSCTSSDLIANVTSFDFSAIKTPLVEEGFYASPLSVTVDIDQPNSSHSVSTTRKPLRALRSRISPKNDLSDVRGIRRLLKTPHPEASPKNDLTDVRGVKRLLQTPRPQRSPRNDLGDVRGVRKLMGSPRRQKSPKNDLRDVRGVKQLLGSPHSQKSPLNDLSDVRGVRKLLASPRNQKSPKDDLTDVRGVKRLLGSPRTEKSPKNDLNNVRGIKKLFSSPHNQKSPRNDLTKVEGVRELFKMTRNESGGYLDVAGLRELFNSPQSLRGKVSSPRVSSSVGAYTSLNVSSSSDFLKCGSPTVANKRKQYKAVSMEESKTKHSVVKRTAKLDVSAIESQSPTKPIKDFSMESEVPERKKRGRPAAKQATVAVLVTGEKNMQPSQEAKDPVETSKRETRRRAATNQPSQSTLEPIPENAQRPTRGKATKNLEEPVPDFPVKKTRGKVTSKQPSEITEESVPDTPVKKRHGKATAKQPSENTEEPVPEIPVKKTRGRATSRQTSENTEEPVPDMPVKKTRGRVAANQPSKNIELVPDIPAKKTLGRATSKQPSKNTEESVPDTPVKKTRGRATAEQPSENTEQIVLDIPAKKTRGKATAKQPSENTEESVPDTPVKKTRGRATAKQPSENTEQPVPDIPAKKTPRKATAKQPSENTEQPVPDTPVKKTRGKATAKQESKITELVSDTPVKKTRGRAAAKQPSKNTEEPIPDTPAKKTRGRVTSKQASQITDGSLLEVLEKRTGERVDAKQALTAEVVTEKPALIRHNRPWTKSKDSVDITSAEETAKPLEAIPKKRGRGAESQTVSQASSEKSLRGKTGAEDSVPVKKTKVSAQKPSPRKTRSRK